MKIKFDSPIDQLKSHLTLQLQAYLEKDWSTYEELEKKILELEKKL